MKLRLRSTLGRISRSEDLPARHGFVPYIYKNTEVSLLVKKAGEPARRKTNLIDSETFATILLLLSATGATQGEILSLKRTDVHLGTRLLDLYNSQHKRGRTIPISRELGDVLSRFIKKRTKEGVYIFSDSRGYPLRTAVLLRRFKNLCGVAGLSRTDGYDFPLRLTDLRHTFAVYRITSWIQNDDDLNVMLPALSAYMGALNLLSSEYYLRLTPNRYQKHLDLLCPNRRKRHWRDDRQLMGFLTRLA